MNRCTGVFALVMGLGMILVWIIYITSGQYDLGSEPFAAVSLLVAELLTAFALVVGGFGVVRSGTWAVPIHLASLGMMLSTSVYSIGVFADLPLASGFFAALALTTGVVLFTLSLPSAKAGRVRSAVRSPAKHVSRRPMEESTTPYTPLRRPTGLR